MSGFEQVWSEPSETPRVDACINAVMARHPRVSQSAGAAYYEEVHQQLAPLARELERALVVAQEDVERLTWAECNPVPFYEMAAGWWATAGRGGREQRFNWRWVIDEARAKEKT